MNNINRNLVLVVGKSATGKSASLRNLINPEGVAYFNTESGKELPFPHNFNVKNIHKPLDLFKYFSVVDKMDNVHTIVIDSITFLMDMYESQHVLTQKDGRKAWGEYAQYFKKLMQEYVAPSQKNIIMIAHTADMYNEQEMVMENRVKFKGSLMNQGVEAWFTQVISTKKVPLKTLEGYSNPLLEITEEDEILGYKHVFQTRITKETINESIRSPMGMWPMDHTYIDNDLQKVIEHTHNYYKVSS